MLKLVKSHVVSKENVSVMTTQGGCYRLREGGAQPNERERPVKTFQFKEHHFNI